MAGAQANIRTRLAPLTGSGRLAPTLVQDLSLYDPHYRSQPGHNLLADGPINFADASYLYQFLPETSCRHVYRIQSRQTRVPAIDERPTEESTYQVAAVCQACRIHMCLRVDYTADWKDRPCPNEDHPVHHLIRSPYRENIVHSEFANSEQYGTGELYAYECSSSTCSAVVTIRLSPEILTEDGVNVLTNPDLLKQRTDEAFATRSGDTEGMRRPSATDVLTDLRTYLRNSWKTESKSEISLDNKRFAVRFGPGGTACKDVLESLGFEFKAASGPSGAAWRVPKPDPEQSAILSNPFNIFLDNIEQELSTVILNRPEQERQASQDTTALPSASPELARVLGCQDYDRSRDSRTANVDAATRSMPFTVLGVPQDISDDIVSKAYDWQCAHHSREAPHYLSALQSIAVQRRSESLDTKCAIEQSNGKITYEQLTDAYKSLGLSVNSILEEDHIIGSFESRAQDARNQEPRLRENLKIIGIGLNSTKIVDYASMEISTYEQALSYLDVTHDTSDDFVRTMYTLKVTEYAAQQEMAAKAVKMIASQRQSEGLQTWMASGFSNDIGAQMDLGEAYQAFEISDRGMDDDTILAVYNMRKAEVADSGRFTRALMAIAQSRNSPLLLSELQMAIPERPRAVLTEPVGLENIGNTCYLNSLLQFLFTIKAVRDIVLDFNEYKMDPTPDNMLIKKVGQRKISVKEVETAQKFAVSLATLFQSMITAPRSAIRPEQELARLTLETDQVKEKIRRRSTLAGNTRPSLGSIDRMEIQGPLPAAFDQINGITEETPLLSPEAISASGNESNPVDRLYLRATNPDLIETLSEDNSSEATLVSRPNSGLNTPGEYVTAEQQQAIMDNKENLAPLKLEPTTETSPPPVGQPLRPASPSKINIQAGALATRQESSDERILEDQPMQYQPPPGPPPIPPRKPVANPTTTLEEYARQQDVTEVVGHCLFQLSCAMRPTGFDKSGEQQDEIHNLFFGECRSQTIPEKTALDNPLPFLNVQAAVNNKPKDVYAALDNYFDLADAGNGRQGYISITRLPPILTVTLGRVVWDSTSNSQKKLDHHVEMPQTLYMDRYLESELDSALTQKRKESWTLKQELLDLAEQKVLLEEQHAGSVDVPSLFYDARMCLEYLEKEVSPDPKFGGPVDIDPGLKELLGQVAEQKRAELDTAKSLITLRNDQLEDLFTGLNSHPYRLHAAFFHRGSHGSGHYWVYINDHKTGIWRKYNDDHVTNVINLGEIFDRPDTTGGWSGPANPYFLVYVRDDDSTLVETVKREPLPADNDLDGVMLEPLGSGSAVARGLMGMSSGGVHSQMTEFPPDTEGEHHMQQDPVDVDDAKTNPWAGDLPPATQEGLEVENNNNGNHKNADPNGAATKDNQSGNWQHIEIDRGVQW